MLCHPPSRQHAMHARCTSRSVRVLPPAVLLRGHLRRISRRAIACVPHLVVRVAVAVAVVVMVLLLVRLVVRLMGAVLQVLHLLLLLGRMGLRVQLARPVRSMGLVRRLGVVRLLRRLARRCMGRCARRGWCRGAVRAAPEVEAGDDVFAELVFVRVEYL